MSRGYGRVERVILEVLAESPLQGVATWQLAEKVERRKTGAGQATPSTRASVWRALASLRSKGAICETWRINGRSKRWVLSKTPANTATAPARSDTPQSRQREKLVRTLGMMGSSHQAERETAARTAEKLRTKLGLTWDDLIKDLSGG